MLNSKVIIYENSEDLVSKYLQGNTENQFMFTAYSSLQDDFSELLNRSNMNAVYYVKPISLLQQQLLGDLDNLVNEIESELLVSSSLNEAKAKEGENSELAHSWMKSVKEGLDSVKQLIEIGADIDTIFKNPTEKQNFFISIYNLLIVQKPYFEYNKKINRYKYYCKEFEKDYLEAVNSIFDQSNIKFTKENVPKKLYLQGFNIITPPQYLLFYFLEKCGYELIFFVMGESTDTEEKSLINKGIYETFEGCEIEFCESSNDSKNTLSNLFSDLINKGKYDGNINDLCGTLDDKINFYVTSNETSYYSRMAELLRDENDVVSFDYKNDKEKIFSLDSTLCESSISMSKYRLSIFLIQLYKMFDKKNYKGDEIILTLNKNILRKCFKSGYLVNKHGENARSYYNELEALLPYFSDLEDEPVKKWRKGFNNLLDVKRYKLDCVPYSPFKVDPRTTEKIIEFVEMINEWSSTLFIVSSNENKNNSDHTLDEYLEILNMTITNRFKVDTNEYNDKFNNEIENILSVIQRNLKRVKSSNIIKNTAIPVNNVIENIINLCLSSAEESNDSENNKDINHDIEIKQVEKSDDLKKKPVGKIRKIDDSEHLIGIDKDISIISMNSSTLVPKGKFTEPLEYDDILRASENPELDELNKQLHLCSLKIFKNKYLDVIHSMYMLLHHSSENQKINFYRLKYSEDDDSSYFEDMILNVFKNKELLDLKELEQSDDSTSFTIDKELIKKEKETVKVYDFNDHQKNLSKFCRVRAFFNFKLGEEVITDPYQFQITYASLMYMSYKKAQLLPFLRSKLDEIVRLSFIDKPDPFLNGHKARTISNINKGKDLTSIMAINLIQKNVKDKYDKRIEKQEEYGYNLIPNSSEIYEFCNVCPINNSCTHRVFKN